MLVITVNSVALVAICLVLVGMIGQQCYFISHNVTHLEMMKYAREQERREEEGIADEVVNCYDLGIAENWRQFLFPPKIQRKA
jgi:hypothetical protein